MEEEENDADAKEEIKNASPTKEEVKSPGSSFEFMNNNDWLVSLTLPINKIMIFIISIPLINF